MRGFFLFGTVLLLAATVTAVAVAADSHPPDHCGQATLATANQASGVKGTPKTHGDGAYTPVLLVHGWIGEPTMWSKPMDHTVVPGQQVSGARSLADDLQRLRGAAVYTLDYSTVAEQWFLKPGAGGKAFLDAAKCLVADKAFTKHKLIVVAHSMGGLITRWAVNSDDQLRAGTSLVLTLGTPYRGSWFATVGLALMETAQVASTVDPRLARLRSAVHLMVLGCHANESLPGCPELNKFMGAVDAVRAFAFGSKEYDGLKPWPQGITVKTLAGRVVLENAAAQLFLGAPVPGDLDFGDGVVDVGSATDDRTLMVGECRYTASALQAGVDGLLVGVHLKAAADKRTFVPLGGALFGSALTTCGHLGESKLIELTKPVHREIATQLAREEPAPAMTSKDLYRAPVPSLCEHPAGTLVDGSLPGIPEQQGYVELLARHGASASTLVFGDLTDDGVVDTAAVFGCSQGGVNWPVYLVLYTPGPKILGVVDLGAVTPAEHVDVKRMTVKSGDVMLEWQSYEGATFCISTWSARIHWDGKKPAVLGLTRTVAPRNPDPIDGRSC